MVHYQTLKHDFFKKDAKKCKHDRFNKKEIPYTTYGQKRQFILTCFYCGKKIQKPITDLTFN
jgi:hypothetical protein